MEEVKKVVKMGNQKIVIVPKKSKIDVGDYVVFDSLEGLDKILDLKKFKLERKK